MPSTPKRTRIDYAKAAPGVFDAMDALDGYVRSSGLEPSLVMLAQLRASQLNGCAYCLDMHAKDLAALGESLQRMISLDAWRECSYYTERERAALEWAEAVTDIAGGHAADAIYDRVRPHFSDKELADLTLALAAINAWNRLSIAARIVPGGYQPTVEAAAAATPAAVATPAASETPAAAETAAKPETTVKAKPAAAGQ